MKSFFRIFDLVLLLALVVLGWWHPTVYVWLGIAIVILAGYLVRAFDRIESLEKRLEKLESNASSSAP